MIALVSEPEERRMSRAAIEMLGKGLPNHVRSRDAAFDSSKRNRLQEPRVGPESDLHVSVFRHGWSVAWKDRVGHAVGPSIYGAQR
jgi:hypothetical protein